MSTVTLTARMDNPALVLPGALEALQAVSKVVAAAGLDPRLVELVNLRASQINGCGVCVAMHPRIAKRHGETDERLATVVAWRESPYFTAAERAALALTEAATRIADRGEPVSDEVWEEAARHFDEHQLAALVLGIAQINVWNRLNVTTRQIAGQEW
jgi:AhpD family alkylhydroperoxidase